MISSLYKLYHKSNGNRTPLEDFNTECLVGIFNYFPLIGNLFAIQFLELPSGDYKFSTQEYYPLSDDPNCFVDMVIKSESCICFVENKVDSTEGYEQINRYQKVLESFPKIIQKEMRYITKNSDFKTNQLNNFKQYRWFEVAKYLFDNFQENELVKDYHQFLKQQHMAQETKFTTDAVIALKNFATAYATARLYIDRGHTIARRIFPNLKFNINNISSYKNTVDGGRVYFAEHHILQTKEKHTEILVALHLHEVRFQIQLWMHLDHPWSETVFEKAQKKDIFDIVSKNETGYMLNFNCKLYEFIETDDHKLEQWFQESLQKLKNFIIDNPDISWSSKLLLENTKEVDK